MPLDLWSYFRMLCCHMSVSHITQKDYTILPCLWRHSTLKYYSIPEFQRSLVDLILVWRMELCKSIKKLEKVRTVKRNHKNTKTQKLKNVGVRLGRKINWLLRQFKATTIPDQTKCFKFFEAPQGLSSWCNVTCWCPEMAPPGVVSLPDQVCFLDVRSPQVPTTCPFVVGV